MRLTGHPDRPGQGVAIGKEHRRAPEHRVGGNGHPQVSRFSALTSSGPSTPIPLDQPLGAFGRGHDALNPPLQSRPVERVDCRKAKGKERRLVPIRPDKQRDIG